MPMWRVFFHHGDFQYVIFRIDAVGVPRVHGGDLPVDHADDAPGTVVHKVLRRQGPQVEGAVGALSEIGFDLRGGKIPHCAVFHH